MKNKELGMKITPIFNLQFSIINYRNERNEIQSLVERDEA